MLNDLNSKYKNKKILMNNLKEKKQLNIENIRKALDNGPCPKKVLTFRFDLNK